jgi:hypothetical protein
MTIHEKAFQLIDERLFCRSKRSNDVYLFRRV